MNQVILVGHRHWRRQMRIIGTLSQHCWAVVGCRKNSMGQSTIRTCFQMQSRGWSACWYQGTEVRQYNCQQCTAASCASWLDGRAAMQVSAFAGSRAVLELRRLPADRHLQLSLSVALLLQLMLQVATPNACWNRIGAVVGVQRLRQRRSVVVACYTSLVVANVQLSL